MSDSAAAGAASATAVDATKALEAAMAAARDVGPRVREAFGTFRSLSAGKSAGEGASAAGAAAAAEDGGLEFKQQAVDLVTAVDKEVEVRVTEMLLKAFPGFAVLGEESFDKERGYGLTEQPTWVIDPVDGTTNFVHGFPVLAVSIALVVDRRPVVGVVYNPVAEEMFHAVAGEGAFLNGEKLTRGAKSAGDEPTALTHAVVMTNVGYDRSAEGVAFTTGHFNQLLTAQVRSVRMGGAAAVDVCYVAAGRCDAFYEWGPHPWDFAAALLVLVEAGGTATDPLDATVEAKDFDLCARRGLFAATPELARELATVLQKTPVPAGDWAGRQA